MLVANTKELLLESKTEKKTTLESQQFHKFFDDIPTSVLNLFLFPLFSEKK